MPISDPKESLLSLLYNVAFDDSLRERFHSDPDTVAREFGLDDPVVGAVLAWGDSRRRDDTQRAKATTNLMQLLGDEILKGDRTGQPYKIW
jgi:hypothetical protein